ncbi:hypothetical protein GE061_000013 [Apolygus lucorum]|uniref:ARID domain-containing protein n=1 Tax=Apolygus lucorum TaxID=248454 RepID=A0A8S9Y309_APOLU|nr:hypothetical protein GE061_000013 [Apolygus lucorum]
MAQSKDQSETCDYDKEKERFLQELTHFHETRGTPSRRPPQVNGHEVDLYKLYTLVTNRGGWVKRLGSDWGSVVTLVYTDDQREIRVYELLSVEGGLDLEGPPGRAPSAVCSFESHISQGPPSASTTDGSRAASSSDLIGPVVA